MEKEFVTYKLALKMKQFGFDEPCFGYYDGNNNFNLTWKGPRNFSKERFNQPIELWGSKVEEGCFGSPLGWTSAPLYQQAFRWFRENYNWTIKVNQVTKNNWSYTLSNFPNDGTYYGDLFKTYEEAELACLEKLIEIVEINNTK